jgi:CheY-like chemotaxis protein
VLVAVSGYGAPEDVARSSEAGFDDHFTKPVMPAVLRAFLESIPR